MALFSVVGEGRHDSVRVGNVAIGFAEQLEADKGLSSGDVPVYAVAAEDYWNYDSEGNRVYDRDFVKSLSVDTGADLLFFMNSIKFTNYSTEPLSLYEGYDGYNVTLPYTVGMDIFKGRDIVRLHTSLVADTLYLFVDSSVSETNIGGVVARRLPEVSKHIGKELAKLLSHHWVTQQRILLTYEGNTQWEDAYVLAEEFLWRDAIEIWMKFATSKDSKKAAFAAYNIAVGCEMLEQFELALKWINYSLEMFPLKESEIYKRELLEHLAKMQ